MMGWFASTRFLGTLTALVVFSTQVQAAERSCKITPGESTFSVHTDTEGLLSMLAHKRVIQATQFSGQMVYAQDAMQNSRIELLIETEGLVPMGEELSESDRETITANLRETIGAGSYPTMHFGSQTVTPVDGGVRVSGTLRMKGVARKIAVDVKLEHSQDVLVMSGEFTVKQSDFQMKPYSALLGTLKVADEIRFEFNARCQLQ